MPDQPDDRDGQEDRQNVGKRKIAKFDLLALAEKLMEKFLHAVIPPGSCIICPIIAHLACKNKTKTINISEKSKKPLDTGVGL